MTGRGRPRGVRGLVEAARTDRALVERLFQENCLLRRENARLSRYERLACVDALTGLLNRRGFDERIQAELSRSGRVYAPISLVFIDLDRYKSINDASGHLAGDSALEWMGRFLAETFRASDVACRLGGDEFAIILPDTDPAGAQMMVDRLAHALESRNDAPRLPDGSVLGWSIGASTSPDDGTGASVLFEAADRRMYEDKARRTAA